LCTSIDFLPSLYYLSSLPPMKKLFFSLLLIYSLPLCSQVIAVNDFVQLTTLTDKRLTSYLSKMSFAPVGRTLDDGTVVSEYFYRNKKNPTDSTLRFIAGSKKEKITSIAYHTSSFAEYQALVKEFRLNGFSTNGKPDTTSQLMADTMAIAPVPAAPLPLIALKNDSTSMVNTADTMAAMPVMVDSSQFDTTSFFQKGDMTVRISQDTRDEVKVYRIMLQRRPGPSGSAVRYADDLLSFDSHQALIAMFGQSNVKRDIYYFTELDTSRCSVIFPNSNRQAIFLWDDQETYRGLSFLIVGGGLHAYSRSDEQTESIALNAWRSSTGLFTGMRISEIVRINEADFTIYGINSEFGLMAVPEKKGVIDFKQTGVVFGCLNCSGSPMMRKDKISAQAAIDTRLQLYITSIVLFPVQ
jgi:hypothetical protein